jgi:Inositol-pentakisphosphate 2-kinase
MKNAKIKSVSSYCPIDLFSGDAERMNGAIRGLLVNPQNNLKMFLDGKMIYNEFVKDKGSLRKAFASLFPETSFAEM